MAVVFFYQQKQAFLFEIIFKRKLIMTFFYFIYIFELVPNYAIN